MLGVFFFSSFLFGVAQRELIKRDFYQFFDGTLFTDFIPQIERDFEGRISSQLNSAGIGSLLQSLPFEPDNLNTGDCVFHASCSVLLLDELIRNPAAVSTVLAPYTVTKGSLLAKIAVLTYMMHSEHFFGSVFMSVLCNYYTIENRLTDVTGMGPTGKSKEQRVFQDWSRDQNTNFWRYKTAVVDGMQVYMQPFVSMTVTRNPFTRGFILGYPAPMNRDALKDYVKTTTGRFIKMSRAFGGLDTTGETGQIEVLRQLANPTAGVPNDMFHTFVVGYSRTAGAGSPIAQQITAGPASPSAPDPRPAFVFQQVPYGLSIKHQVQKSALFLVEERSESHAITSSEAVVLAQHVWWSGDRGLRPSAAAITYIDSGHVQNPSLNGTLFTVIL